MSSSTYSETNVRKALKKLKEIDVLKGRDNRSQEEDEKIRKEDYYRRVLDPFYRTEEEKEQEQRKYDMLQR